MIKVGITEMHGIAHEYSMFPAEGVSYSPIDPQPKFTDRIFRSEAKGVLSYFHSKAHDILEAPLFPILTKQPWIFTPGHFASAVGFNLFGLPTPRAVRLRIIKHLMLQDNFKKLLFKSQVGKETLRSYGGITDPQIWNKTEVVYPAVREVEESKIRFQDHQINILFVGEFLRKGGANTVDAFLELAKEYSHIHLRVCSFGKFQTRNQALQNEYLGKIHNSDRISFGFVDRETLMNEVMPNTDIYLCPTYQETWGYSIEEAMAFGIPVVATKHFAIPEMIEHEKNGYLIETEQFDFIRNAKSYVIDEIPQDFMEYMTGQVYFYTKKLIESITIRKEFGLHSLELVRTKFSMATRNKKMKKLYEEILG
jgi:glycosyltransferase involved in cell wall biosynthesis